MRWTLLFFIILFGCKTDENRQLTIAVAANMQEAIEAIATEFTEKTEIKCEIVLGSSGKLTAQILEGAPYDVFLAANTKYPLAVYEAGLSGVKPAIYANGKMVLWSRNLELGNGLSTLTEPRIKHIAIPNPEIAPYGLAAVQAMKNAGIFEEVKSKLVYGESVSQCNQFIFSGAAEIGFTSMSTVLSPEMKDKGTWSEVDKNLFEPIEQAAVIIGKDVSQNKNALEFYNFLFSKTAKDILIKFGYE